MAEKPVWRRDLKWRQLFVRPPLVLPPLQPHSSGLTQRQAQTTAKCASCLLSWLGCVGFSHSTSLPHHITFWIEIKRNLPAHPKRTQIITECFSDFSFSQVCFELATTSNQLKRWIGNARSSGTGCLSQCLRFTHPVLLGTSYSSDEHCFTFTIAWPDWCSILCLNVQYNARLLILFFLVAQVTHPSRGPLSPDEHCFTSTIAWPDWCSILCFLFVPVKHKHHLIRTSWLKFMEIFCI